MTSVLIAGGAGQLGLALERLAPQGWDVRALPRAELDLADPASIRAAVEARAWDCVINAAAYTAVDRAEDEIQAAWTVNALGPALLADAARKAGIPIIHVSTDYVYDGTKTSAYVETDPVAPRNVYGASKLAGELAVQTANPAHVIVRTAWLFSPDGANFVKTMLRLAADRPQLSVVADQRGCPTRVADLAAALWRIAERMTGPSPGPTGVFHFAGRGEASWCDLAQAVMDHSRALGGPSAEVRPIATKDYPTRAARPANSVLDTSRIEAAFGVQPQPWQVAVQDVVEQLVARPKVGAL